LWGQFQPTGAVLKNHDVQCPECRRVKLGPKKLLAGLLLVAGFMIAAGHAQAETRTLRLYFIHTKERAEITFKRNGRYVKSGLDQINRFLRDWRRNEPANMDPRLLDLVWEVYRESGSRDYINVVSAYRSPQTNAMLRSRSSGVAEKSQHMLGKAMDFFIPDVKLSTLRAIALRKQMGGVGYYPRSGSPFVHLDVGGVRYWPRMSRRELASLFPDGKTLYIPSDGKPMPGYKQALASYEARKRNGGSIQVADDTRGNGGRGLLAMLFGGGADEEEDNAEIQVAATQRPQRAAVQQAPRAQAPQQVQAPQQPQVPPAQEEQSPATLIAALPPRELPVPRAAPRPDANVGSELLVASNQAGQEEPAPPAATGPAAAEAPQQPAQAPEMLAAISNVPLPSRRPDFTPPEAETQVAEATAALPASAYVTPTRRPERPATADAIAALIAEEKELPETEQPVVAAYLSVPQEADAASKQTVAAAARAGNEPASEAAMRHALAKADTLGVSNASAAAVPAAVSALVDSRAKPVEASPRMAMLEDRSTNFGARTTPKSARVDPAQAVRQPEPNVMPVQSIATDLALSKESMLNKKTVAAIPAFSTEMAEAPTAVYTDGFKQGGPAPDPRRFSGKAVVFLSLAKFE